MKLTRATTAIFINSVLNHPEVYSWVRGEKTDALDVRDVIADPNHVVLIGEGGGVIFVKLDIGLYEAHTAVLPEYRGRWTIDMGRAALTYMFCQTDAVEILTKCPKGNLAAATGAKAIGGTVDFTTRSLWQMGTSKVPMDIYSIDIHDWIKRADDMVVEGAALHRLLRENGVAIDHEDDADHDRYVGATWHMIEAGQVAKGIHFYYRWAVMAGYRPIAVISERPLSIDIGVAALRLEGKQWTVAKYQPQAAA